MLAAAPAPVAASADTSACPQITALIFLPSFPGWLAPLAFNPVRFLEFFSFAATLLGTWVASGGFGGVGGMPGIAGRQLP